MKISRADAKIYQIDDAVTLEELFDGKDFAFDLSIGRISGRHPRIVNRVSDRAYLILSGEITVYVGDSSHDARAHDLVLVPANTPHGLNGTGEYVVITAPPFAEENEEPAE